METVRELVVVAVVLGSSGWFGWRLASIVRADGYGFRSSSGLPRDWVPPELPSTPYSVTPPR